MDRVPKAMGVLQHPHNSLAQAYFELGLAGLVLFLMLLGRGLSGARGLLAVSRKDPVLRSLVAMTLAYLGFEFLMSLKQATFMAALGFYLSVSMLEALRQIHQIEIWRSAQGAETSDFARASSESILNDPSEVGASAI